MDRQGFAAAQPVPHCVESGNHVLIRPARQHGRIRTAVRAPCDRTAIGPDSPPHTRRDLLTGRSASTRAEGESELLHNNGCDAIKRDESIARDGITSWFTLAIARGAARAGAYAVMTRTNPLTKTPHLFFGRINAAARNSPYSRNQCGLVCSPRRGARRGVRGSRLSGRRLSPCFARGQSGEHTPAAFAGDSSLCRCIKGVGNSGFSRPPSTRGRV